MTRTRPHHVLLLALLLALAVVAATHDAFASSTPVGPLPAGPIVTIDAPRGTTVALSLPTPQESTGLVWRIARPFDAAIAREVSEGEVGRSTVVLVRLVGRGATTIRFARTRGDASSVATAARTFRLRSR
ncbi:MAG: hypothetical protein U0R50_00290 [Gaiellales bacterium]